MDRAFYIYVETMSLMPRMELLKHMIYYSSF